MRYLQNPAYVCLKQSVQQTPLESQVASLAGTQRVHHCAIQTMVVFLVKSTWCGWLDETVRRCI